MKTRLFLIRHGETDYSRSKKYYSDTDVPLNQQGIIQTQLLAKRFQRESLDSIYTSPLQRTYQTANIIAQTKSIPVTPLTELKEIGFGAWEGLQHESIMKTYAQTYQAWLKAPHKIKIPDGESHSKFRQRSIKIVKQLIENNKGKTIAIVSHGGPIKIMLAYILGLPFRSFWEIRIDIASISAVTYYDSYPVLEMINNTEYLFYEKQ